MENAEKAGVDRGTLVTNLRHAVEEGEASVVTRVLQAAGELN